MPPWIILISSLPIFRFTGKSLIWILDMIKPPSVFSVHKEPAYPTFCQNQFEYYDSTKQLF
jgi:hypothetical protein